MTELTPAEADAEHVEPDWTTDPETGRSNSSPQFQALAAQRANEPTPPHPPGSAEYWKTRAENAWRREDDTALIDLEMGLRLTAVAAHLHVLDGIGRDLAGRGHNASGKKLRQAVDEMRRTLRGELPEDLPGVETEPVAAERTPPDETIDQ